jgi:hypothetical protein
VDTALAAAHLFPAFLREHILRLLALAVQEDISCRINLPALCAKKVHSRAQWGWQRVPPPTPPLPDTASLCAHTLSATSMFHTARSHTVCAKNSARISTQRPRGRQGWRVAQTRRDLHRPRRSGCHQSAYALLPRIISPRADSPASWRCSRSPATPPNRVSISSIKHNNKTCSH